MKEKKLTMTVPFAVSILSFIAGCISYFFITNPVPVHWNVNWEVDGTAPKEIVFLFSAVPLLFYLILGSRKTSFTTRKGNRISVMAAVYLFIVVQWLSIASAIKPDINVKLILPCAMGIAMLTIGNFAPTITRNHKMGFRTPWSVKSDLSWKKTNRYGGYMLSLFGILMILGGICGSIVINIVAAVGIIVGVIALIYLSYVFYKKDAQRQ